MPSDTKRTEPSSIRQFTPPVCKLRAAIEQVFHAIKEVHGVGQAQVRNSWSNVAAYHVKLGWHTLIELWA
jgi:hypothetical protein